MSHTVNTLHGFVMTRILHRHSHSSTWLFSSHRSLGTELDEKLQRAQHFDEVMAVHEWYIATVVSRCMLHEKVWHVAAGPMPTAARLASSEMHWRACCRMRCSSTHCARSSTQSRSPAIMCDIRPNCLTMRPTTLMRHASSRRRPSAAPQPCLPSCTLHSPVDRSQRGRFQGAGRRVYQVHALSRVDAAQPRQDRWPAAPYAITRRCHPHPRQSRCCWRRSASATMRRLSECSGREPRLLGL